MTIMKSQRIIMIDACSPDCAYKLWDEYIHDSAGPWNTKCIEVEHVNCWMLENTED